MVALVALRLAIGFHFYQEGAGKLRDGNFSSVGFLSNAKGPFAPAYQNMVWDADGLYRLDERSTLDQWAAFRDQAAAHFGFDDAQTKRANKTYDQYRRLLSSFLGSNREEINEYINGIERRDRYRGVAAEMDEDAQRASEAWTEVPSLRGQLNTIETELKKKRGPWLSTIDKLWADYESSINALATDEQYAASGPLKLERLGRRALDSMAVDRIIPYFDLAIGVLLVLGLFTRVASAAGAAFLASVVLSQWPLSPDATPIYYQSVELCGLLVLAGTAAGRFAGLDYFLHLARMKCCPPKQES